MRQVADILGKPKSAVYEALRKNRIVGAHWVDKWWVIQEDFRIIHHGIDDALVKNLPPELIADEPPKNFNVKLKEYKSKGNLTEKFHRKVSMPGFTRCTEGMSGRDLYRLTGVHPATQAKLRRGERVKADVALRLANGLDIDVEELLKKS